ncbi:MAG: F-box protein [Gammaproteobacteria bacterium]|nr:F-box protein [Gammaproteobacteria bacterium]
MPKEKPSESPGLQFSALPEDIQREILSHASVKEIIISRQVSRTLKLCGDQLLGIYEGGELRKALESRGITPVSYLLRLWEKMPSDEIIKAFIHLANNRELDNLQLSQETLEYLRSLPSCDNDNPKLPWALELFGNPHYSFFAKQFRRVGERFGVVAVPKLSTNRDHFDHCFIGFYVPVFMLYAPQHAEALVESITSAFSEEKYPATAIAIELLPLFPREGSFFHKLYECRETVSVSMTYSRGHVVISACQWRKDVDFEEDILWAVLLQDAEKLKMLFVKHQHELSLDKFKGEHGLLAKMLVLITRSRSLTEAFLGHFCGPKFKGNMDSVEQAKGILKAVLEGARCFPVRLVEELVRVHANAIRNDLFWGKKIIFSRAVRDILIRIIRSSMDVSDKILVPHFPWTEQYWSGCLKAFIDAPRPGEDIPSREDKIRLFKQCCDVLLSRDKSVESQFMSHALAYSMYYCEADVASWILQFDLKSEDLKKSYKLMGYSMEGPLIAFAVLYSSRPIIDELRARGAVISNSPVKRGKYTQDLLFHVCNDITKTNKQWGMETLEWLSKISSDWDYDAVRNHLQTVRVRSHVIVEVVEKLDELQARVQAQQIGQGSASGAGLFCAPVQDQSDAGPADMQVNDDQKAPGFPVFSNVAG